MTDLDLSSFKKKYSLAISDLEKRIPNSKIRENLSEVLYKDSLNKKIDMDELTVDIRRFYSGDMLSQVKLNQYVSRYK